MTKFEIIESPEQLELAIEFLANGFCWRESQTSLIRRSVLACNGKNHPYAGCLVDADGRIVIAILFFYQGEVRAADGLMRTVMGTSSWYADESHKGLASIQFIKRVNDYLKSRYNVIVIYTPTEVATELHRRLGFKHQSVSRIKLFAWRVLLPLGARKLQVSAREDQLEYLQGFSYLGHLSRVTLKVDNVDLAMVIRVAKKEKFSLSMPIVEVLWADSYQTLSENIAFVSRKLCIRTRALLIRIYVNSPVSNGTCAWMVLDPSDTVSFVSPVQSELTCM
jgi:hypothetical protein